MSSQNHTVIRDPGQNSGRLWLLLAAFALALPLKAQEPEAPRPPRKATVDTAVQPYVAPEVYIDSDFEGELVFPELEDMEVLLEEQELQYELLEDYRQDNTRELQEEAARAQREAARVQWEAARVQREAARVYRRSAYQAESVETIQAYKDAYGLILDQKWKEARRAFEDFLEKYSNSRYVDDARFWICYAMEEAGLSHEDVFEAYHQFIQEFANSKWLDDARANIIRLGRELAAKSRKAKAKYGPIIEQLEEDYDIEVAIATLDRMSRMRGVNNEKAIKAIIKVYDRAKKDELRKKIVYALRRIDDPAVVEKLIEIAKKDPDKAVRNEAISALRRKGGEPAIRALIALATGQDDVETRRYAVSALGRAASSAGSALTFRRMELEGGLYAYTTEDEERDAGKKAGNKAALVREVVSVLLNLAKNDPHIKVRTEAVSALSRIGTPEAQEALINILEGK